MSQDCLNKAVITIATGKPIYIEMAVNLARSFKWWHKNSSIEFYLATDRQDLVPNDLQDINIIELNSDQANQGFCSKLYLDKLVPANKNLFIDADCLCYGNLDFVFKKFEGHAVSVIGKPSKQGEFFGNIEDMCTKFEVPEIPVFVGSIYYLEKGETCSQVFSTARKLKSKYDEYGLVRLRNKPNEEPLIAISMAIHHQKAIEHDGCIKADMMQFEPNIKVDILSGFTQVTVIKEHQIELSFTQANPAIIHYNDNFIRHHSYIKASVILNKMMFRQWNSSVAKVYGDLFYFFIEQYRQLIIVFKDNFRIIYRKVLGYRKIKANVRS